MSNLDLNSAIKRIEELVENGKDLKRIRAHLLLEDYPNKVAEAAIKELGLSARRSVLLTYNDILEYLGEEARTEKELYTLVLEEATRNEARWIRERNKIRILLSKVYIKFGEEFVEELASKELKQAIKDKGDNKDTDEKEPKNDSKADNEKESDYTDKIKEARNRLDKAIKAYSKGNAPKNIGAFHPDKVSYFGDDSLTRAYTKFFQELTA